MDPSERRRRFEEFKRSIREGANARREKWEAGQVSLGGEGRFPGISDPVLRECYLNAARDLLDRNRHRLPQFALPIFFLQRHALELALKDAIRTVADYHHVTSHREGAAPEPPNEHDLRKLLHLLREQLSEDDPSDAELAALVERFHGQDKRSTWARYRTDHKRAELDLGRAQGELEQLFEHMFADPSDPEAPFGLITEFAYVAHDFAIREEFGD